MVSYFNGGSNYVASPLHCTALLLIEYRFVPFSVSFQRRAENKIDLVMENEMDQDGDGRFDGNETRAQLAIQRLQ